MNAPRRYRSSRNAWHSCGGIFDIAKLEARLAELEERAADPALCPEVSLSLDVLVAPGPDQGRTVIVDQAPNAIVCLAPDTDQIKALAAGVLGR